jgi:hypothetical protein
MNGMRFEAVSLIQQIVMKELKVIWEEAFSWAIALFYEQCKCARSGQGQILGDGINRSVYLSCVCFMASIWELNCHTVYNVGRDTIADIF